MSIASDAFHTTFHRRSLRFAAVAASICLVALALASLSPSPVSAEVNSPRNNVSLKVAEKGGTTLYVLNKYGIFRASALNEEEVDSAIRVIERIALDRIAQGSTLDNVHSELSELVKTAQKERQRESGERLNKVLPDGVGTKSGWRQAGKFAESNSREAERQYRRLYDFGNLVDKVIEVTKRRAEEAPWLPPNGFLSLEYPEFQFDHFQEDIDSQKKRALDLGAESLLDLPAKSSVAEKKVVQGSDPSGSEKAKVAPIDKGQKDAVPGIDPSGSPAKETDLNSAPSTTPAGPPSSDVAPSGLLTPTVPGAAPTVDGDGAPSAVDVDPGGKGNGGVASPGSSGVGTFSISDGGFSVSNGSYDSGSYKETYNSNGTVSTTESSTTKDSSSADQPTGSTDSAVKADSSTASNTNTDDKNTDHSKEGRDADCINCGGLDNPVDDNGVEGNPRALTASKGLLGVVGDLAAAVFNREGPGVLGLVASWGSGVGNRGVLAGGRSGNLVTALASLLSDGVRSSSSRAAGGSDVVGLGELVADWGNDGNDKGGGIGGGEGGDGRSSGGGLVSNESDESGNGKDWGTPPAPPSSKVGKGGSQSSAVTRTTTGGSGAVQTNRSTTTTQRQRAASQAPTTTMAPQTQKLAAPQTSTAVSNQKSTVQTTQGPATKLNSSQQQTQTQNPTSQAQAKE